MNKLALLPDYFSGEIHFRLMSVSRKLSVFIRVNRWPALVNTTLATVLAFSATTTHAEEEPENTDKTTTDTYRSPWADENEVDPFATPTPVSAFTSPFSTDPLLPKRNPDDIIDQRPTRKVYDVDNRGDRELYPDLIIEPSIYDRYEVYETDRDGLALDEPKAIIKHGLHDSYEVYKTDRDGMAVDEPHLVIKEGVYDGEYKVYETDRYGMPEDIPSKVIKTDRLGRQEVYRTDHYGMPIGDPIDEQIIE
jgi:hypothetical protein